MTRRTPKFKPRFSGAKAPALASRYSAAEDAEVERIGAAAKSRGHLTRDEFLALCRWKTPRSRPRCMKNSEGLIREATRFALNTPEEELRIGTLTLLDGVGWPTASVILHLCHRDRYPILDVRALDSLGCPVPGVYDFAFWRDYTLFCRQLAERWRVSMRELDRALWQYSKDRSRLR
jgi:hypothetical protein